ncbi:MAG TPA: PilZ domain-containing protein [Chthonomonadales bacterium]|nr:PilZ domain-containing protein [Chthonomonadales bacterium]
MYHIRLVDDPPIDDRRDALREAARPRAVMVDAGQEVHAATIIDVSRLGLRLRLRVCLPTDTEVIIDPPSHTELAPIRGVVVRQSILPESDDCLYEYGVQFADVQESQRHRWFLLLRQAA